MTIFLSDQQMGAAAHGTDKTEPTWELVALPEGPQPLPPWALDLGIRWYDTFGNVPTFGIRAREELREWPDKRFVKTGSRYMATHPDGRAEIYYHDGAVRPDKVRRFQMADGTLRQYPPQGPGGVGLAPGEWVDVEKLCTTQQGGFGGSHIELVMEDGSEVVLRGPWHGGSPPGYLDTSYVDTSGSYNRPPVTKGQTRRYRGWMGQGGRAGLYIAEDLLIRLFARFQPHLRLARITNGRGTHLEPLKPDWDEPKAWIAARARRAMVEGALAAMTASPDPIDPTSTSAPIWAFNELVRLKMAVRSGTWNVPLFAATDEARAQAVLP